MTTVVLPLKTVSVLNGAHRHGAVVARRRKHERLTAYLLTCRVPLPCTVRLTRMPAGVLDGDNLCATLKSVRDGIADRLGVGDNDSRVTWCYDQVHCRRGCYGVRVTVVSGAPIAPVSIQGSVLVIPPAVGPTAPRS